MSPAPTSNPAHAAAALDGATSSIEVESKADDWAIGWQTLRAAQWLHFVLVPALPLYPVALAQPWTSLFRFLPAAIVAGLCLGYAYGLNAIADRRGDGTGPKNPLAGFERVPTSAWAAVAACALGAVALPAAFPDRLAVAPAMISIVAGTVYSVGPRVKRLPIVGTLANCVIFAPLSLLLRFEWSDAPQAWLLLATFAVLQTQTQLAHEAGDLVEDIRSGVRSSAVVFGPWGAMRAAGVLGIGAALVIVANGGVSLATVVAAVAVIGGGTIVGGARPEDAARMRHRHRRWSLATGTLLFAVLASTSRLAP